MDQQQQPMTLSEFFLRQRSVAETMRDDYESNIAQLAQVIERQNKRIQELTAEIEDLKKNTDANAPA